MIIRPTPSLSFAAIVDAYLDWVQTNRVAPILATFGSFMVISFQMTIQIRVEPFLPRGVIRSTGNRIGRTVCQFTGTEQHFQF